MSFKIIVLSSIFNECNNFLNELPKPDYEERNTFTYLIKGENTIFKFNFYPLLFKDYFKENDHSILSNTQGIILIALKKKEHINENINNSRVLQNKLSSYRDTIQKIIVFNERLDKRSWILQKNEFIEPITKFFPKNLYFDRKYNIIEKKSVYCVFYLIIKLILNQFKIKIPGTMYEYVLNHLAKNFNSKRKESIKQLYKDICFY